VTWTGPVRFSTVQTPRDTGFYNTYFEGTVVWQKETTPDPREDLPVLPGGVRYRVASGQVHVRVRGLRIFLFPEPYSCTDEGDGDVALTPNDTRSAFPDEAPFSHLDVTPDGRYAGYLYKEAGLTVVRTCEERLFPNATEGVLSFGFSGMLNASRRIQGEMTEASTFETESAAWDFSGR
jgi:hypothetical protein